MNAFRIMDITRLRILTLKSKAFFYSDPNWTIEKLINDKSFVVLKTYYEQEKISFSQEVLNILKDKYSSFIEIEKPSKLMEWQDVIFKNRYDDMTYNTLFKMNKYQRARYGESNSNLLFMLKKKKREMIQAEMASRKVASKKELQAVNHGR